MAGRIRLVTLAGVLGALLLAGCGGGGDEVAEPLLTGTAPVDPAEQPSAEAESFESEEFEPAISFELPTGWRITEEFGVVQAFFGADDRWALTFESDPAGGDVAANMEQIRGTPDLDAEEPQPVTVAGHEGLVLRANVADSTLVEGTEYFAIQHSILRAWVLDVEGTLVRIFAEAGTVRVNLREEETDNAFFENVERILGSLEFAAPPGP